MWFDLNTNWDDILKSSTFSYRKNVSFDTIKVNKPFPEGYMY